MSPRIYEVVKELSIELVNSSESEDTKKYWADYQRLVEVCSENESSGNDHPFQWETLADFTTDSNSALKIYLKALQLAELQKLPEYTASIKLAMAERYSELGIRDQALTTAHQANHIAKKLDDLQLRKEISEFLLNESQR